MKARLLAPSTAQQALIDTPLLYRFAIVGTMAVAGTALACLGLVRRMPNRARRPNATLGANG